MKKVIIKMIQDAGFTINEKNIVLGVMEPFGYWKGDSNETNKWGQPKMRIEVLKDINDTVIIKSFDGKLEDLTEYQCQVLEKLA